MILVSKVNVILVSKVNVILVSKVKIILGCIEFETFNFGL